MDEAISVQHDDQIGDGGTQCSKAPLRFKAIYRGLGSIDLTAACRSALLVGKHPTASDTSVLVHIKSNLAKSGVSQGYAIEDGVFRWTGPSSITSADLLAPEAATPSATSRATEFLRDVLADGEMPRARVQQLAEAQGIPAKPLRSARERMRVVVRLVRTASGQTLRSMWRLPDSPSPVLSGANGQAVPREPKKRRKG